MESKLAVFPSHHHCVLPSLAWPGCRPQCTWGPLYKCLLLAFLVLTSISQDAIKPLPAATKPAVTRAKEPAAPAPAPAPVAAAARASNPAPPPRTRSQTKGLSMTSMLQNRSEAAAAPHHAAGGASNVLPGAGGANGPSPSSFPLPDIDALDRENPLAVADYVNDIYSYYKRVEPKFRVAHDYMKNQVGQRRVERLIIGKGETGWKDGLWKGRRGCFLYSAPLYFTPHISLAYLTTPLTPPFSSASPVPSPPQREITERMRGILMDWLVEVHLKFKLQAETLFLTVNLIDRFLEKKQVTKTNLQLVSRRGEYLGSVPHTGMGMPCLIVSLGLPLGL